ncbi:FcoT family thioesterase [Dapis sp. BLCC M126]|uniref:FcoT family thioesterase n=1 Tax=Dapis sp. BLCC M126 TaxID=3400189 RepID=UPI003CF788E8
MYIYKENIETDRVNQDLLQTILEPYKEECRYLKNAEFNFPESINFPEKLKNNDRVIWYLQGDFAIPESCYIDDTGHFNSVEFNICYNQLFYVLIGYLVKHKLWDVMGNWDWETYKHYQLSNFLIVKFASKFKKPINSDKFHGTLSINKYSARKNLIILKTSCSFDDENEGWSEGDVTIAVLNNV